MPNIPIKVGSMMAENKIEKTEEIDLFELMMEQNFLKRMDWFTYLNQSARPGGIVFVGDSLTEEFLVTDIYQGLNVHNRGIGGDTTIGLLKRMNESIFDLQPRKVILLIGTNDLALLNPTPEAVITNIQLICEQIKAKLPDAKLVLLSLYPTIGEDFKDVTPESIKARGNNVIDLINGELFKLTSDLNIHYLDANSRLKDENGQLNKAYTRDGLHLNTNGYQVIQELLQPFMK
jgi:lysophospholipase L1-like esterase